MSASDIRASEVFNLLADAPAGLTVDEIAHQLACSVPSVRTAIQALRDLLADHDTINVICDPPGARIPWTYRLVGSVEEAKPWMKNRGRDADRRLTTLLGVATSMANQDGRTVEGRKGRIMKKGLSRLVEDLREVEAELR